ncbi:MAG: nitroreductase [Paludibacter sp.]|nr:nitroreductase [Bacteroidales bacterium]MCM1068887.1 nitroreductase [Prevotella sp.]MCM1353148.1 nitroreductase [Bacteroides sp.]MCM1442470.1 nitroreductase [Muribaculum sp.]MCM1481313.1 nitroreductase [Paludibacter sp.]
MNIQALHTAIRNRHSVRQYTAQPIEQTKIAQISALAETCNKESELHIQVVTNEPQAFSKGLAKYGKFQGVSNYLAIVGKKTPLLEEHAGYYGEQIVLLMQTLGLNSCWVGLTYSKTAEAFKIEKGEKLIALIAFGYGQTNGVQHPQKHPMDYYCTTKQEMPEWFKNGMEAALLAPTALNQQKFEFILHEDNTVEAKTRFALSYAKTDLGIAKYHFEIGAGKDNVQWR